MSAKESWTELCGNHVARTCVPKFANPWAFRWWPQFCPHSVKQRARPGRCWRWMYMWTRCVLQLGRQQKTETMGTSRVTIGTHKTRDLIERSYRLKVRLIFHRSELTTCKFLSIDWLTNYHTMLVWLISNEEAVDHHACCWHIHAPMSTYFTYDAVKKTYISSTCCKTEHLQLHTGIVEAWVSATNSSETLAFSKLERRHYWKI